MNITDRAALLVAVREKLRAHCGFSLATINLDHLVKLRQSAAFRKAYEAQSMIVADGNPIVWLSQLAGRPVDLVPGSDMVLPLAEVAAQEGVSIALVGSTNESLARAAGVLQEKVPDLKFAFCLAPPFGFDPEGLEADAILEKLRSANTGLCLIALGAPKQEIFAARGRILAPATGFASIGAGLDFLAGSQVRAPDWVQSIAMEWLWRALSNPRRMIPRYVACAAILPAELLSAMRLRKMA